MMGRDIRVFLNTNFSPITKFCFVIEKFLISEAEIIRNKPQ